ncbi:MAG: tRNA threonylcarbamoyladenosine dehydratase [Pseudomonadota bacterium]
MPISPGSPWGSTAPLPEHPLNMTSDRELGIFLRDHSAKQIHEQSIFMKSGDIPRALGVLDRPRDAECLRVVIDAIDQASIKTGLALHALNKKIPLVMTGGAGGRIDPSLIKIADLSLTHGDRLTAKIRHDVKKALQLKDSQKVGIDVIFTDEVMKKPEEVCEVDEALTGLHCGGYGSSVMVTATFGFMAASVALKKLL